MDDKRGRMGEQCCPVEKKFRNHKIYTCFAILLNLDCFDSIHKNKKGVIFQKLAESPKSFLVESQCIM